MIRRTAFALLSGVVLLAGTLSFIKSEFVSEKSGPLLAHGAGKNICIDPAPSTTQNKNESDILFVTCGGFLD